MDRPAPSQRERYRRFTAITPRWNDIDVFGHINNAEFYAFFDTAVMRFMIDSHIVSESGGQFGTLVAETGCRFHREVTFRDSICVGLTVAHLGNSSVRYEIGVFANDSATAAADGHFVHVFVDRSTRRPLRIPDAARLCLQDIAGPHAASG
ncbi:MAG: thioesterase family protein [Steroidobacteraceae bacterium]|jgi:acyl-CoA thioester hydrolase